MPATINHIYTSPVADGTATSVVRPSDWNSVHSAVISAAGSEIVGAFSNANGVSFGLSGTAVTASVVAGGLSNIRVSAGTTSNLLSALTFNNGNGISFGIDASTITASHNGLTTAMASNRGSDFVQANAVFAGTNASGTIASNGISVSVGNYITTAMLSNAVTLSNIRVSAGTTSNLLSALTFNNGNGVTFGLDAGTITASVAAGGGLTNINVSAGTTSNNLSAFTFNNGNGITFGLDASTITASHNGLTSQSNQVVSADNGSYAFQTLSFSNANGVSFGTSGGSAITASHNGLTSQSNQQMTFFATGNTTQSSTGTTNASSVIFRGEGVASVGITGGSVVISVPAGGGGLTNINISAGTTSNNLSALTFSNGSGVSFGLNGSTLTASVVPQFTYSAYIPDIYAKEALSGQQGNGTFFIQPLANVPNFQFDNFVMPVEYTNASNTSGSFTVSFWVGLYSRNDSTLSLVMSTSASANITNSGTAGSYSLYGGQRNFSIGWTNTVLASDYWLGIGSRTTTGGAAGMTMRQMLASNVTTAMSGYFGQASNATQGWAFGQGFYSATTAGVPNSIGFTQIQQSGSLNRRVPIFMFQSNLF